MLIDAFRRTQQDLDAAIGDAELAAYLARDPSVVRELTPIEARLLWPAEDFQDTQPMAMEIEA